jgi:hypothetical protein
MSVSPVEVYGKAKAFVDSLCKLPRIQYSAIPNGHYGSDCNTLLLLALEACPELDERLLGHPVPLRVLSDGREVCDAAFAEIETYGRQVMEQMALRLDGHGGKPTESCGSPVPTDPPAKGYDVTGIRHQHAQAYAAWSVDDDTRLRERFGQGATVEQLARELGRQPGGIRSRLRKLGLGGLEGTASHSSGGGPPESIPDGDADPRL